MAAYDYSTTAYGGGQAFAATTAGRGVAFRIPVNTATLCTAFGISAFTAADTVKIWKIPEHFHMEGVRVEVKTVGTPATSTMDVGDATVANGWQSNTDLVTVADTSSITYNSVVGGKIYVIATDPYIVLRYDHAAATGTFDLVIWGIDTDAPEC